jgi:hypothetical protein
MGVLFTIYAGPRQRSLSRVWVPWDSRPYFNVSDSRLPFISPPATRRATVEVFDLSSTRDKYFALLAYLLNQSSAHTHSYSLARIPRKCLLLARILGKCLLLARILGKCLLLARIHGGCLLITLTWKARSVPSQSPRIRISIETCVSEPLPSNGLFRLSGATSHYDRTRRWKW